MNLSKIKNSADRTKFKKILNYIEKYYVGGHQATFPPKLWAGLIEKDEIRYTNNGLESFHSHFKQVFLGKNKCPNVFEFIHALEHFNSLNIVKLQSHKDLPVCVFSAFKAEHKQLLEGQIPIAEFLKKLSKNHKLPSSY